MTEFVNPYTFLPLAGEPERSASAGHVKMADGRVSGSLRLRLTARTPLLIGGYKGEDAAGEKVADVPRRADGTPMIPGSGLLGAVRSVHEALAGGCLRVLDSTWVPVHRHPASTAETDPVRLGVVLAVDGSGRAGQAGLCDQVVWVDQRILPREQGQVPQSGDRLILPAGKAVRSGNRDVLRPQDVDPGDVRWASGMTAGLDGESWALLVTDTHARAAGKPVYFAAGRIGTGTRRYAVGKDAWDLYQRVVAGADDLRPARLPDRKEPAWDPENPAYEDVFWPLPQGKHSARSRAVMGGTGW